MIFMHFHPRPWLACITAVLVSLIVILEIHEGFLGQAIAITYDKAIKPVKPNVPWGEQAHFQLHESLSDDFIGKTLDSTKWDDHGIRNPETGCPQWNGPVYADYPRDSTLYPATTDPKTGRNNVRFYDLKDGELRLKVAEKPLSFFKNREYYCDNVTFTCNHDPDRPCYLTDYWGNPIYTDESRTQYAAAVHDKCKMEPFCVPHHEYVTGEPNRAYSRIVSSHITSRSTLKYGYIEVRARLPKSPAVTAVWLHNDDMTNGWCRYRRSGEEEDVDMECPSVTRSRRWQEIDILEAMDTPEYGNLYVPNIHAFSMYKGEFSSPVATQDMPGGMGGGPIIINGVFDEGNPSFSDVPKQQLVHNDWHWEPGPVATMEKSWSESAHTVGLYWSPNELRFYIDGKEASRIRNALIHQPMFLDISFGLNTPWALTSPSRAELSRAARIDYIRTWKVFTEGGHEPPSELPLGNDMVKDFNNQYGHKLYGVFDRFPVNDTLELRPSLRMANTSRSVHDDTKQNFTQQKIANISADISKWFEDTKDYLDERVDEIPYLVRFKSRGLKPAGGRGNIRFSRKRNAVPHQIRQVMLTRKDRFARVIGQGKQKRMEIIPNGGRTVFDVASPNDQLAGWSMIRNRDYQPLLRKYTRRHGRLEKNKVSGEENVKRVNRTLSVDRYRSRPKRKTYTRVRQASRHKSAK